MEAIPLGNMYIQYDIDIRSVSPFATRNSAIQCMFTRSCLMPYVVTKYESKIVEATENMRISSKYHDRYWHCMYLIRILNVLCDVVSSQPECGKPCNPTHQVFFQPHLAPTTTAIMDEVRLVRSGGFPKLSTLETVSIWWVDVERFTGSSQVHFFKDSIFVSPITAIVVVYLRTEHNNRI